MKKLLLLIITLSTVVLANDCSPYFNPKKFYDAPEMLSEILDENFPNGLFTKKSFKNNCFISALYQGDPKGLPFYCLAVLNDPMAWLLKKIAGKPSATGIINALCA